MRKRTAPTLRALQPRVGGGHSFSRTNAWRIARPHDSCMPMATSVQVSTLKTATLAWAASHPRVQGVALLGSWPRDEATPKSDVDLLIVIADPSGMADAFTGIP